MSDLDLSDSEGDSSTSKTPKKRMKLSAADERRTVVVRKKVERSEEE